MRRSAEVGVPTCTSDDKIRPIPANKGEIPLSCVRVEADVEQQLFCGSGCDCIEVQDREAPVALVKVADSRRA